ncbi:hypothetical protein DEO72_LG9g1438 [Vigna unguiculata]|uniref:Uncharacterized protein n=1 Tax=Vigna unguiculata TaxID=3917 RepID=A0A4D6MY84_VIGUN|nr:hypothetical protein DEO72_LG9g1438 [Vigna unguiculata]
MATKGLDNVGSRKRKRQTSRKLEVDAKVESFGDPVEGCLGRPGRSGTPTVSGSLGNANDPEEDVLKVQSSLASSADTNKHHSNQCIRK